MSDDAPVTSLKDVCKRQGGAYFELAKANSNRFFNIHEISQPLFYPKVYSPYVYCGMIRDARFFGRTFIYTDEGEFIFNCQSYQGYTTGDYVENAKAFILNNENLSDEYFDEECIFLGCTWSETSDSGPTHKFTNPNFGHFIFEYLNRLVIFNAIEQCKDLPVVIYDQIPDRWVGFLELMGVSRDRITRVSLDNPPIFRKAWVASAPHFRDNLGFYRVWSDGISEFRRQMLANLGHLDLSVGRRVYLGRGKAQWRNISNEDEVIEFLKAHDFEVPDMQTLSPLDQIRCMAQSEVIVSAVGAGTILTQFAPQHAINILLAPKGVGNGLWGGLGAAMSIGQAYLRLDCEAVETKGGPSRANAAGNNELADYKVDLSELEAQLTKALGWVKNTQTLEALRL